MRRAGAVLVLALGVVSALGTAGRVRDGAPVGSRPSLRPAARVSSAFNLFAPYRSILLLNANRVECTINSLGEHCSDANNSSVIGGGFWPKGTNDQYIFNGGLQLAAIIPGDRAAFGWAGDTVGAFLVDLRGDQYVASALTGIFDSRDPTDLENWPSAAYVRDTSLFDASLIGRKAASEQDSWVRYWDGLAGSMRGAPAWRSHSMGLLIDQRTLAWNRPEAGRDVLFVLLRIINVTARDRSRYAGLAAAGYTPEDIGEIAKIGADYHARSDTAGVNLPDTGFTWTNLYVGMSQDPDIGQAGSNYSTAVLPFATALAYHARFREPNWAYPPDIFVPPFATAPGLVGTKFLRVAGGPVTGSSAVRMYTTPHDENPLGVAHLWRVLASRPSSTDFFFCNAPLGTGTPVCRVIQTYGDTRWTMSNGPWPDVGGGQSVAFVIAYVFAAPVAAALQSDGQGHALGSLNFDLKPGFPATGPRLAAGTDTVKQIDRVAGWTSFADANGNGDIEQREVRVQPYSLLGKAAVAQIIADNKFVLAAPPAAPRFFLLPGDGQVTVVWERSASEVTGDPYFAVASNPLGQVYDPNLRQFDVEGYRIWRGASPSSLQLVAQFDLVGTTITDHTGQIFTGAPPSNCAPELGIVAGCRVDFLHGGTLDVPLAGNVVQVPPGGRVLLTSGAVATFRADTAVSGGGSGLPPLQDTEIRFVYVDEAVRNSTPYYYAVTAFDVNSINSGPSSLESEWVVRSVQPRVTGSNARAATVVTGVYGADGTRLDPEAPWPKIDSARGTFDGPIPPANRGAFALVGAALELLPAGNFVARIDSISPGLASWYGNNPTMYVTFIQPGQSFQKAIGLQVPSYATRSTDTIAFRTVFPFVPLDSAQARRYRVQLGEDLRMPVEFRGLLWSLNNTPMGGALARGRWPSYDEMLNQATRFLRVSYWYDENAARQPADPTIDPYGSQAHSAGQLTGVDLIYAPAAYRQNNSGGAVARSVNVLTRGYSSNPMWYPADFVVTWGAGGAIAVRDSTHRTNLPYKKAAQIGYGFISAASIVAAGITGGDLADGNAGTTFDPSVVSYYSLYTIDRNCTDYLDITCADLAQTAVLQPIDVTADGISDGNGIALVINGEPFFMLMNSLPAAGTKWHLKAVGGGILNATCTPALPAGISAMAYGSQPTDCSGYTWTPFSFRPAFAPGLQFKIIVSQTAGVDPTSGDLNRIHTVPDPVYFTDLTAGGQPPTVRFVNLPDRAVIRIYSASGILVTMLTHNDATAGGEEVWDLTNRGGRWVASGVYFYHVEGPDHRVKIGRFTVVHQRMP